MSSTIILSRPLGPKDVLTTFAIACVARTGRWEDWLATARVWSARWWCGGGWRRGVNRAYHFGHECRSRKSSGRPRKGCRSWAAQTWTPFLQLCVMAWIVGRGEVWRCDGLESSFCLQKRRYNLPRASTVDHLRLPLDAAFFGGSRLARRVGGGGGMGRRARKERLFQFRQQAQQSQQASKPR